MDENTTELVNLLCTRIGIIMEDMSMVALTMAATPPDHRMLMIAELLEAVTAMMALVDGPAALSR